jgi:hypothetical protein
MMSLTTATISRETLMTKDQANILIFMVGLIAGSLIVHAIF